MGVAGARGDDCVACGVANGGDLMYTGPGQGAFVAETKYTYVGYGGDFAPRRRDFTCLICSALALLALLLSLLALWCLWPTNECYVDQANWQYKWSKDKQSQCCASVGIGRLDGRRKRKSGAVKCTIRAAQLPVKAGQLWQQLRTTAMLASRIS